MSLSIAATASALVTIAAYYSRPPRLGLVYIAKPLTTSLILTLAAAPTLQAPSAYGLSITLGLAFSLAGDIWLMLPADYFRQGLASFLAAHVCYIFAFARQGFAPGGLWTALALAAVGIVMLRYLWPGLPAGLRAPVGIYVVAVAAMAALAVNRALTMASAGAAGAAAGALLFVVSDAGLAVDRFRRPFRAARAIVLGAYFAAQLLIAVSAQPLATQAL